MTGRRPQHAQLAVVSAPVPPIPERGRVRVLAQLPPQVCETSCHAAQLVHLFDQNGYDVATFSGPGLSLSQHQLNFASRKHHTADREVLCAGERVDTVVIYARALEFGRYHGGRWHLRRLEEIRRFSVLTALIGKARRAVLVTRRGGWLRRDHWGLIYAAGFAALRHRTRLSIVSETVGAGEIFRDTTGLAPDFVDERAAEDTVYRTAFAGSGPARSFRLSCIRADLALSAAQTRQVLPDTDLVRDVGLLIGAARADDLRDLPQFRLMSAHGAVLDGHSDVFDADDADHPANCLDPEASQHGVPVTAYMMHLRAAHGLEGRFPLGSRAEARRFLNWYLWEASTHLPAQWLPVPAPVRAFLAGQVAGAGYQALPVSGNVAQAFGRDAAPFALSNSLADLAMPLPDAARHTLSTPAQRVAFVMRLLFRLDPVEDVLAVLGKSAVDWLTTPVGRGAGHLTRLELLLALHMRVALTSPDAVERPWASEAIARRIRVLAGQHFPHLRPLFQTPDGGKTKRPTLTIAGLSRNSTGVGANLHMSARAFRRLGIAPEIRDIGDDLRVDDRFPDPSGPRLALRRSLVLHHVNADRVPQSMVAPGMGHGTGAAHVGFLLWEFDSLPRSHDLALEMLDEIWVPTRFVRQTYAKLTSKPVHNVLKGLHIPPANPLDLTRWGIGVGTRVFLTCFDFHSSLSRKNPLAAVRAFLEAFPSGHEDVALIVKTTPPVANHWGDAEGQWPAIERLAARDRRIVIVPDHLPFLDLLGLIRSADCLLSTHRAEGFGLMPAFALGLGVPVMATDYSGTTDFCTEETAFPIPAEMIDVARNQMMHPIPGARWAEIDVSTLSQTMRAFAGDPGEGRKRALRGKALIRSRYTPGRQAERYRTRLKSLGVI